MPLTVPWLPTVRAANAVLRPVAVGSPATRHVAHEAQVPVALPLRPLRSVAGQDGRPPVTPVAVPVVRPTGPGVATVEDARAPSRPSDLAEVARPVATRRPMGRPSAVRAAGPLVGPLPVVRLTIVHGPRQAPTPLLQAAVRPWPRPGRTPTEKEAPVGRNEAVAQARLVGLGHLRRAAVGTAVAARRPGPRRRRLAAPEARRVALLAPRGTP